MGNMPIETMYRYCDNTPNRYVIDLIEGLIRQYKFEGKKYAHSYKTRELENCTEIEFINVEENFKADVEKHYSCVLIKINTKN